MKYYANYNILTKELSKGQVYNLSNAVIPIEISSEVYHNLEQYMYKNNEIVLNPNYETELKIKEREKLNMLSLTSADVERALYKSKGIDFEDILEMLKDNGKVDIKALKIELKANNFYRGNPYVNIIGEILGYSSDDLDYLFKNKELPNTSSEVNNNGMVL